MELWCGRGNKTKEGIRKTIKTDEKCADFIVYESRDTDAFSWR